VSRFRLVILLALVAVTALPTTAHAGRIPYCHLFSPDAVGHAAGYRGVRVEGRVAPAPALGRWSGTMAVCDFWSGRDQVAESVTMTFRTSATTARQFKALIKNRARDKPRRVSGPWKKGYRVSNREIFLLKGTHIFDIAFTVHTNARAVHSLAARAWAKL
jgi:hypothetical protein